MSKANNGANLGFENKLWEMADKLRGHMDASEYKHVVLGLIFLKYISDAFQHKYDELAATQEAEYTDPEDRDEYLADNIFWVPPEARWEAIQAQAPQPVIGKVIDEAMTAIERENPSLKGVLPKDYARPTLDKTRLGELVKTVGDIDLKARESGVKDPLGRVYEYNIQGAGGEGIRLRDRSGETLFIDARRLGKLVDRVHRELTPEDIDTIAGVYHAWRTEGGEYEDKPGWWKSATLEEIKGHGHVLTPGRYVGAEAVEDDGVPFEEKMAELTVQLYEQFDKSRELEATIRKNLEMLGFGGRR